MWIFFVFFSLFFLFSLGYVELGLEVGESALSLFFLLGVALWPASSLSILNHQTIQLNKLGPPPYTRLPYPTTDLKSLASKGNDRGTLNGMLEESSVL